MKKIFMAFATTMMFGYASAQMEPKTTTVKKDDTTGVQVLRRPPDKTVIANKSILKRNTLDAGMGKPDPIKKDIHSNEPVPKPAPTTQSRVEAVVDTITPKPKR
ncbi:hypothetical protein [Flavobacterium wongokense]|uniref:hypothetical protein n=1 Tax=Flavobacterium wongokense TaxID=2910674 RepID=UPI001F2C58E9|nr:hypothetical protein [Flavobacterium sp. WG47]MCF6131874.1 hypothetical protein [Flavobacterium sp. WG47]